MKQFIIIALLLTIVGCSIDNDEQHSYTIEQHDTATGLTLTPSENMWVSFPEMVSIYIATEACMGMTAEAPTVRFLDFFIWLNSIGGFGSYLHSGFVLINTYATKIPLGITRDKRTDTEVLKHEYIHHILNMNGADYSHSSPMFKQCGIGVNTYN